jgi:hypothetical protein
MCVTLSDSESLVPRKTGYSFASNEILSFNFTQDRLRFAPQNDSPSHVGPKRMPLGPVALIIRRMSSMAGTGPATCHGMVPVYIPTTESPGSQQLGRQAKEAAASHPYTRWQAHQ